MMQRKRVVVTGLGTVNCLSKNVEDTWQAMKESKSGISEIGLFDPGTYACRIAGEVKNFDPSDWMDKKQARKMARFSQFSLAATIQAAEDASIMSDKLDKERVAVILGNGIGGHEIFEEAACRLYETGIRAISPLTIPKLIINEGPANVAIHFGFRGPCYAVCTACTSATDAIGSAMKSIRAGEIDVAITGGMEAAITPLGVAGFIKLTALSTNYNDRPAMASRPFDKGRDGFVMGEGAGILILEELEHARKRNAKIYAEVVGYGITCDAHHLTSPETSGDGPARSMTMALKDAGMQPEEIDYINAHGTSTPTNDPVETRAIKKAFGEHAKRVAVSSTKSMITHMVGAAGGIEAIVSILAIRDDYIPPTINLENADPECDLDYVPNKGRKASVKAVLSDNLGFGGHNGSVIFREFKE